MRPAVLSLLIGLIAVSVAWAQTLPPASSPTPSEPPPTRLEQTGVSPDGPPSDRDMAWDNRIRSSVTAAQGLQGPLDGRWQLYDATNRGLYIFQMVDPASGKGPLEGVWRDLRRPAGSLAYGVVAYLSRGESTLTIGFNAGAGVSIVLQALADGVWSGEMTENGVKTPVTLRRR